MSESPPPGSAPGDGPTDGENAEWPAEQAGTESDAPRASDSTNAYPTADDPTHAQQGWYAQPQQPYPQSQQDYTRVEQQYSSQPQEQYTQQQYSYQQYAQQYTDPQYTDPQYTYQQYPQQPYTPQQQYSPQQWYQYPQQYQYPQPYQYPPMPGYGGQYPRRRMFGIVAAALTVIGGIVLVISFIAVDWIHITGDHASFSDIRNSPLLNAANAPALPHAYFNWLAWLLFGVVMVCGLAGALPTPAHLPFRVLGALVGVTGIIFTYFAYYRLLGAITHYTVGYSDSLRAATVGVYMALGGFLIAAVGAAIGPHRTTRARR